MIEHMPDLTDTENPSQLSRALYEWMKNRCWTTTKSSYAGERVTALDVTGITHGKSYHLLWVVARDELIYSVECGERYALADFAYYRQATELTASLIDPDSGECLSRTLRTRQP